MRRRPLAILRETLLAPSWIGAAYVLLLVGWAGAHGAVDADVGDVRRAAAMELFIGRRFAGEVARMRVGLAATAIALGLVLGLVAELLGRVRYADAPRPTWRLVLEPLALVIGLHALFVAWAMADSPQLYAATWYAQGGLSRTAQVAVTDWLGTRGVVLLGLGLALAYVGPRRLASRVRSALAARGLLGAAATRAVPPTLALAVASAAFSEPPPRPALLAAPGKPSPSPLPNVLVIAADSLRDDRLDPKLAPNMVRLASRGTRFDRAYVSLPRTFPSWVTILTGRHGHHHGIRTMFPTWEDRAKDFDALPSRFTKAGYETAVVSDYAGDIFGRIDLGFARIDTPSFDFRQLVRQKAVERETPLLPLLHSHVGRKLFPVMRELSAAADPMLLADDVERALASFGDRPFFLTAFFSTAHFPYAAPAPYYSKYTDPRYRGRFKYHKPTGLGSEAPPDAADVKQIQALYDGAVSAVDDAVGRVLHTLAKRGLDEKTIVIITADHGETLFDDGHGQGHGDHLFGDEATHVPLVICDPRVKGPGRREPSVVRDVDIAPTLYDLTGVEPPLDLDGRSLAPALRGEPIEPRFAYAETELWFNEEIPALPPELRMPYPGVVGLTELDARHNAEIVLRKDMAPPTLMARHRMIRDQRYKLVYVPTRTSVRWFLYDTVEDPKEKHDLSTSRPEEASRLKAELWKWMLSDPRMEQKGGYLVPREGPR